MDRLGVSIDRDFVSTGVPLRTSKGMLSTTDVIYYLANRHVSTLFGKKVGRLMGNQIWWRAPAERHVSEPVRIRLTGKD